MLTQRNGTNPPSYTNHLVDNPLFNSDISEETNNLYVNGIYIGSSISQSTTTSNSDQKSVTAANDDRPRGPRNQPKRKRKHRR